MKKTEGLFCQHAANKMRKSIKFAAHVIMNKVKEFDYTPEEALRATVASMGTAFFATQAGVSEADVITFVDNERSLESKELRNYLAVFRLEGLVDACELKHVDRHAALDIVDNLVNIGHEHGMDSTLSGGAVAVGSTGIAANVGKWSK